MFTRASFLSNSNRTGLKPDRSYSVKSAVATKFSACLSVLNLGIFFFIVLHLLPMHVAGADWSNEALAVACSERKVSCEAGLLCAVPRTCMGSPRAALLDHAVGALLQKPGHVEPECLRGLQIDHQLEARRLHHRQVRRLLALEDAPGVDADLPKHLLEVGSVAHQAARLGILPLRINRRNPVMGNERDELPAHRGVERIIGHEK